MAGKLLPGDDDLCKDGSPAKETDSKSLTSLPSLSSGAPTWSGKPVQSAQDQPSSFDILSRVGEASRLEFLLDPLPDEFNCSICLTVMNDPILTSCGDRFCRRCLEGRTRDEPKKKCPVCDDLIENTMADKAFERKIKALEVYCINKAAGCEWTGELVSLDNHLLKSCSFQSVSSGKFESVSVCDTKELPLQTSGLAVDMLSHMTKLVKQFDAQQKVFDDLIRKKDEKIRELEQRIAALDSNFERELSNKQTIRWTSIIPVYPLALIKADTSPGIIKCLVPERVVPQNCQEILVLIAVHTGNTVPHDKDMVITVFVEDGGTCYTKFMEFRTYKQQAWNDNTNNVWLPMPTDRVVNIQVPVQFRDQFWCDVCLSGYR